VWAQIRQHFEAEIAGLPDSEFTKTFFSSITRRLFGTVGVDANIEFVATDLDPLAGINVTGTKIYPNRGSLKLLFEDLLGDLPFRSPWRDLDKSVAHLAADVSAHLHSLGGQPTVQKVEIIVPVFYQLTRAYIVGRITGRGLLMPLVIALKNTDGGMLVDAGHALRRPSQHRVQLYAFLFSRRSRARRRRRRVPEIRATAQARGRALYRARRAKQGKTERYRELMRHLEHTSDLFVHAPGERGLVMVCFTLPSFDVVFKVIRDRFAYPKNILREDVLANTSWSSSMIAPGG